jgi:O-antigen/teichoic acid export membrane protein
MAVMSGVLLVTSLRTVAIGRLQKDLHFGRLAISDTVQALSTAVSTVVMVFAGLHYWALVLGQLIGNMVATGVTLVWIPPRFAWPRVSSLREVLTFSRDIFVARLSWFVQTGADMAVVGWVLGGHALGAYSMAASLGRLPVEKIAALATQVSPAFLAANHGDRSAPRHLTLVLTQALAFTVLPICGGILLLAPEGVALALGDQWSDVIRPLQIFAIVAAIDSIGSLLSSVLVMTGGARLLMYISLVGAGVLSVAFYVGSQWGLVGVAAAYVCIAPFLRARAFVGVARRTGLSFGEYCRALGPALNATLMMMIVVLNVRLFLLDGWPLAGRVALEVFSGIATYLFLLATIHRVRVVEFFWVFRGVRAASM